MAYRPPLRDVDHDRGEAYLLVAQSFWERFYRNNGALALEDLAGRLYDAQTEFYGLFKQNEYAFAKRLLPLTALCCLLSDDGDIGANRLLARKMIAAFRCSMVSVEIKTIHLDDAIKILNLDDNPNKASIRGV